MLKVKLGGSLAGQAGGRTEFEIEGRNVADVLRALGQLCPELKPVLDKGISISIDGTLHREALYQPLKPENEIFLLPRMAAAKARHRKYAAKLDDVTLDAGDGPDLLDALGARHGIICLVGAGGKKTSMVRLAARHPGHVALTATTRVPFRLTRNSVDLISLPEDLDTGAGAARLAGSRVVGYAGSRTRNYRLAGADPATIAALHDAAEFDVTYVKADGARTRHAKAHKPGEPSLVPGTVTILLFASVHAIGRAIDEETVHRPELFATIAGAHMGDTISPGHLAAVLSHQAQALRDACRANVIPVINMADDGPLLDRARETAEVLWKQAPKLEQLAITAMIQPEPLKELLTRLKP